MFFKRKPTAETQFLNRLKGTSAIQEVVREIEGQELAARQNLIAEMRDVQKTIGNFNAMRNKREAEINAEILVVERRRNELGAALNDLDAAGSSIRSSTGRELSLLTAQIKVGADPRINNFVLWAQCAHTLAISDTWSSGQNKAFAVNPGTEKLVAGQIQAAQESAARLARLVMDSVARADAMRLEAELPDDVMLELQSMAAAIHAEYSATPKSRSLATDFLAPIPGVMVIEINEMNEAVQ